MESLTEQAQNIIEAFLYERACVHGLSENTIDAYRRDLCDFASWVDAQQSDLLTVDRSLINQYMGNLSKRGLSAASSARKLSSLRCFYKHLHQKSLVKNTPVEQIDNPKYGRRLPHTISEQEIIRLLRAPSVNEVIGLRDRAMLELLYACGLRVTELVQLCMDHISLKKGVVRVIGKGNRERLVPIGMEAVKWIEKYLSQARPNLAARKPPCDYLFISHHGKPITRYAFWHNIKKYAKQSNISTKLSPHVVRHAFATHLINHDADLRVVQLLLGHSSLNTTQIYTHVARARLQQQHRKYHPRG